MRVGSPETDHADPFDPRSPGVQVGRDVIPPEDERAGIVTTSDGPGGWGEDSEGGKPRKASTVGFSFGSTRRQHGLVAGTRPCRRPDPLVSLRGARAAGDVRRERAPRGAPLAHEGNTLKGQAQGRSGASRAGRAGGVGREGGSQTPHVARGDGGSCRHISCGSAWLRLCRRARKPRRGSIAGRVARRPSGR
jgi:hypothetical protein